MQFIADYGLLVSHFSYIPRFICNPHPHISVSLCTIHIAFHDGILENKIKN